MDEGQLQAIIDNLEIGVVVVDSEKRVLFRNARALCLLGRDGQTCHELFKGSKNPCSPCRKDSAEHLKLRVNISGTQLEITRTELEGNSFLIQIHPIVNEQIASRIDSDSGLLERSLIDDHLQREISRARRFGGTIGLIMLKISDLSNQGVNSAPKIVARILRGIGEILGGDLRAYDLAFRYSQDTFAVILPGEAIDGAMTVAHRLYSKIKNLGIQRARIGVSTLGSASSAADAIDSALRALYIAEHSDEPISTV